MRLLGVEVRRLLARRMLLGVALAGVAAVVLVVLGVYVSSRPLSPAQVDEAQRAFEAAQADWERNGEEMVASCEEAEDAERAAGAADVEFGCDDMAPREEWYLPQPTDLVDSVVPLVATTSVVLLVLALVVGVTSTAAEISTGSLGTWLTFVPRRLRVLASKLAAAGVVPVPLVAGLLTLLLAGVWAANAVNDGPVGDPARLWPGLATLALRVLAATALAGVVGAALGMLLRHTAAALGVLVGWTLVVESLLSGLVPALQPWLLRTNVAAWVQDGTTYWTNECTVTASGTTCESLEHHVSLTHGGLWLAGVALVLVVLTAAVFRRRDVV